MRRLKAIFFMVILGFFVNQSPLNSQVEVDTIDVIESDLEDRHLRYMYNFVLNGIFFQYQANLPHIGSGALMKNASQNEIVLIVKDKFPIRINDLKLFIKPDSILEVKFVKKLDLSIKSIDLISQYDFEYLQIDTQNMESDIVQNKMIEDPHTNYAIQFSNIFIIDDKFYLSVVLYFHANYNPDIFSASFQMYEFEWCESMGWVYPKRVSDPFFRHITSNKGMLGGTIKISSLECP